MRHWDRIKKGSLQSFTCFDALIHHRFIWTGEWNIYKYAEEQNPSPFVKLKRRSCRTFLLASSARRHWPKHRNSSNKRHPAPAGALMISWRRKQVWKTYGGFAVCNDACLWDKNKRQVSKHHVKYRRNITAQMNWIRAE